MLILYVAFEIFMFFNLMEKLAFDTLEKNTYDRSMKNQGSKTSPRHVKMDKPWFFSDKPPKNSFYKISSYQGFPSKQTPIRWVRYHLRTVIRNPRRNVELIMLSDS